MSKKDFGQVSVKLDQESAEALQEAVNLPPKQNPAQVVREAIVRYRDWKKTLSEFATKSDK